METYTRQLLPEDWKTFRDIRLLALQESAKAFGSSYTREIEFPKSRWKDTLSQKDGAIFGLFKGNRIIGLGSIKTSNIDNQQAGLFMGYITAEYRGKGFSKKLYISRIEWALKRPSLKTIFTINKESNLAAQGMNKGFGFKLISRTPKNDWPDGSNDDELRFELDLEQARSNFKNSSLFNPHS